MTTPYVSHGTGPLGTFADWLAYDEALAEFEEAFRAHYGPSADQMMDAATFNLRLDNIGVEHIVVREAPEEEPPPTEAPTVVDAPYVSQAGNILNCTMGNWNGEPTSRTYQWQSDGADVGLPGTGGPNYTVRSVDVGKTFTCVQVASNAAGDSAPVTSNAHVAI